MRKVEIIASRLRLGGHIHGISPNRGLTQAHSGRSNLNPNLRQRDVEDLLSERAITVSREAVLQPIAEIKGQAASVSGQRIPCIFL